MKEQVVVRYKDGTTLKGAAVDFSENSDHISIEIADRYEIKKIDLDLLKAVFFVKSLEGEKNYRERKSFAPHGKKGDRVFIKFMDGESLVGFLSGDVPWDRKKGYFLAAKQMGQKGFFLIPADEKSNNMKVFVILSFVEDVSVMA
jgi:hypothetical protein